MMTEIKTRPNLPNLVADVPNLANGIIADPNTKTTYRIGKFLGKGGFARVHEVTNLHNNVTYAAKIIPKSKMTRKYHIAKVAREIMLHKDLIHDNVVKLELFFEDVINAYIILENCPNQSLVHLMKKKSCFSIPETRYYVKQLIAGTKYIHSNNIIHRDLNREICFIRVLCGTPNYIAPEVLNKSSQSFPIDVWAIGCTIYCLMFGIPPYESATLELTYERIKSNSWDKSKVAYHPALLDLLDRVLVLDPNERLTLDEIEKHIFFDAV
ncbi:serine/threonine-protein kinase plk-1-like [Ctenocephalides felis]|uniref:serine/threonine-protein kinase plk-1-like n=1 Tax=Ctenocephalides felis TaxID=7515 RepID=UPI000E6E3EE3|nr:serine/threonine-protein kinase plk-1-like [Ctenocephalides felis]